MIAIHDLVKRYGAFTAVDTLQTAEALIWFSTGIPAYVLIRVLQPGFFAREDTVTPTIFAGISAAGALWVALHIAKSVENAVIVFIVCDRGDRYLSTGVFPA